MSAKTKHEEVNSARYRLNATLQVLVDKKDDGESSGDLELQKSGAEILQRISASPSSSPIKRGYVFKSSTRKRKLRRDELDGDSGQFHHTFIMKLFDRSVDLAQFDDAAPLYPICRAWIRNQPHSRDVEAAALPQPTVHFPPLSQELDGFPSTSGDEDNADGEESVYRLPAPVLDDLNDLGNYHDRRIPSPLPQTDEPLDIHSDPDIAAPPEQLLLEHLSRWRSVRERWRQAGIDNEEKYSPGMTILKDMFYRNCKDN